MNHEEEKRGTGAGGESGLEARVVAWVLGEASVFEAAELERLVAERPELAGFKRRIEAVHGLAGDAVRPDAAPLRLAPERRRKLLRALAAAEAPGPDAGPAGGAVVAGPSGAAGSGFSRRAAWMAAAACVVVSTLVATFVISRWERSGDGPDLAMADSLERQARGWRDREGAAADKPAPGEGGSLGAASRAPAENRFFGGKLGESAARAEEPKTEAAKKPASEAFRIGASGRLDAGKQLAGARTGADALGDEASDFEKTKERQEARGNEWAWNRSAAPAGTRVVASDRDAGRSATESGRMGAPVVDDAASRTVAAGGETRPAASEETSAASEPVSTFSLHVGDVSFRIARAVLARGGVPDPATVRPEEFYNAFAYGDPMPTAAEKVACRIEQAAHPFLPQRNLVRIGLRVAAAGRGAGQPLRLTLLLDTSGSMEREDRVASVRRAVEVLASLLGPADRVTLVGFARRPRLLAESLPGDEAARLVGIIAQTPSEGGTNLEEALGLAGELARRQRDASAQNRIVLLTDGAANLGNADPAQLAGMIESLRQQGIAFDACGVGVDGLDDAILEALTRQGDGRYYVLDSPAEADAGFAQRLAGAFRPAAENVKVQVRFNPARVGRYRLAGFERHRLREEDFRDDAVDAAELAAGEAGVAVYQVEVLPEGEGELGEVFVRFRDTATGTMVERSWTMLYEPRVMPFDRAGPAVQLAGTAALLAEKLRGGAPADAIRLGDLVPVVNGLRGRFADDARVQELVEMFGQMRRLGGD